MPQPLITGLTMPPRHDIEDLLQQARTKLADNTEARIAPGYAPGRNMCQVRSNKMHSIIC